MRTIPLDVSELPLISPEMEDYKPTGDGQPPLARATDWTDLYYFGETDPTGDKPTVGMHWENFNKQREARTLDPNKNYWVFCHKSEILEKAKRDYEKKQSELKKD